MKGFAGIHTHAHTQSHIKLGFAGCSWGQRRRTGESSPMHFFTTWTPSAFPQAPSLAGPTSFLAFSLICQVPGLLRPGPPASTFVSHCPPFLLHFSGKVTIPRSTEVSALQPSACALPATGLAFQIQSAGWLKFALTILERILSQ